MTNTEIANEINRLKPDFKEFWENLKGTSRELKFTPTNNTAINLFQIELLRIYHYIHPRIYLPYTLQSVPKDIERSANYTPEIELTWRVTRDIESRTDTYHKTILSKVINAKQYLNPYLRSKLGFTNNSTKDIKVLQDNEFSLSLFKEFLANRKLPSTEVITYFNQIKQFKPEIRDQYMDILLNSCKEPSKKLQQEIDSSRVFNIPLNSSPKYIALTRYVIRGMGALKNVPIPEDLYNERDSEYTPFICGVPRKPTPTKAEVSSLVGIMLVIESSDLPNKDYIVKCLQDHLSNPTYGTLYTEQLATLREYADSIYTLTKGI